MSRELAAFARLVIVEPFWEDAPRRSPLLHSQALQRAFAQLFLEQAQVSMRFFAWAA